MASQVGKDIKLDAVDRQLEACRRLHMHAGGALVVWPGMLFLNSCGYSSLNVSVTFPVQLPRAQELERTKYAQLEP